MAATTRHAGRPPLARLRAALATAQPRGLAARPRWRVTWAARAADALNSLRGDDAAARPGGAAWDLVPWTCVLLTTGVARARPRRVAAAQLYPWLASLLLFGLPHGACDHLVLPRIARPPWTRRDDILFYLLYLAGCGLVLLLWVVSAPAGLLFFLALTIWHWGSADGVTLPGSAARYATGSLARGLIVVLAPIALHPAVSMDAFAAILALPLFGAAHAPWFADVLPRVATTGAAIGVAAELDGIARSVRRGEGRQAAKGTVELALLLGLFAAAPPVAAVGVYFVAWHAFRHVLRVGALLDENAGAPAPSPARRRPWWALVAHYHARALPLTAVSLAGLAGVALAVGRRDTGRLVAVYLVLLSALTLPHAAIVALWDYYLRAAPGQRGAIRK